MTSRIVFYFNITFKTPAGPESKVCVPPLRAGKHALDSDLQSRGAGVVF